MRVSVDKVTRGGSVSVVIGQAGGKSVGHGGDGDSGSRIGQGSYLTNRINKTILVIVLRESLEVDIL